MKKLIAILLFSLSVSCASMGGKCKAEAPTPQATPEQVMAEMLEARMLQDLEMFWENEQIPLTLYFTMQAGVPIAFEKTSIDLTEDMAVAIITLNMTEIDGEGKVVMDRGELYLVLTRPEGIWQLAKLMYNPSEAVRQEMQNQNEEGNE